MSPIRPSTDGPRRTETRPWGWATRALLAYRGGDAESAIKYVTKSDELQNHEFAHAMNLVGFALAQHQHQHPEEARKALDQASQLISQLQTDETKKGSPDLRIAEVLLHEAEAKIKGKAKPE